MGGASLAAVSAGPASAAQPQPWEITLQPAASPIMAMIHSFNNGTLIVVSPSR
jgi:cytochrome c oxidase subunit 2